MPQRSRRIVLPTPVIVALLSVLIALAVRALPTAAPTTVVTRGTAGTTAADVLSDATTAAASTASPSVVLIRSSGSLGSGVIVDKSGYIVTNHHVLGREGNAPAPSGYPE